jgi:hypothetical protein
MTRKIKNQAFRNIEKPHRHAESFVFILGVVAFLTHLVFTRSGWMMNPDESELLATARLAARPGGMYANYTTSTYGPIWPEFLAFLSHFGMQLEHVNAHRLSLIMKILIFVTPQYLALKKFRFSILGPVLIPLNIALFLPTSNEFAFLATELLPLVFLTTAVILILYMKNEFSTVLAGSLFTLSVFSKYQSLLMIFILVFFIFLRHIKRGVFDFKCFRESMVKFGISLIASFSIFLISLKASKTFGVFFNDSFLTAINYSTSGGFGGGSNYFEKLRVGSTLLIAQPFLIITLFVLVSMIKHEVFSDSSFLIANREIQFGNLMYLSFTLFSLIGFITISIPGNGFPHYLLFFIWTQVIYLLAFVMMVNKKNLNSKKHFSTDLLSKKNYYIFTLSLLIFISTFGSVSSTLSNLNKTTETIKADNERFKLLDKSEVLKYCPVKSEVLIWGWSSELFAYYNWTPVPYIVNDVSRIKFSYLGENFSRNVNSAISSESTDCIFEAIGPQYFGSFTSSEGLDSLSKESLEALTTNYSKYMLTDGTVVWSRK